MAGNLLEAVLLCGCCGENCPCPCCPDCWRNVRRSVGAILQAVAGPGGTDCGKPEGEGGEYLQEIIFGCTDVNDEVNNVYPVFVSLNMTVKVFCDRDSDGWTAQYKSDATGQVWTETPVLFTCPDCDSVLPGEFVDATFTFTAYELCDTSGGPVIFPWYITITITVECG